MSLEEQDIKKVSLWNPNTAGNWSILLSPVFGAWIHAKNWKALGEEKKSKQSMYWLFGFILILIIYVVNPFETVLVQFGFLFIVVVWYFTSVKVQVNYVKEKLNDEYEKKGFLKPIGLMIASLFGVVFLGSFLLVLFESNDISCGSANAKQVVFEIVRDEVNKIGKDANSLTLSLENVRTTNINSSVGSYECTADLRAKGPNGNNKVPITYTSQLNDKMEVYVEVFGL